MERFEKQTNYSKYFIGIFQIGDAGRFVEIKPFCKMEALFKPLVTWFKYSFLCSLIAFKKSKRLADLVILIVKNFLCLT